MTSINPVNQHTFNNTVATQQLQNKQEKPEKASAAIKIQKTVRGFLSRKKLDRQNPFFPFYLFKQAQACIENEIKDLLRISPNRSIYLPIGIPIVIKESTTEDVFQRFTNMNDVRKICYSNTFKNIVIPKARLYKNRIIEQRLPLLKNSTKEQIGLYIEYKDIFTNVAKEMTSLLCQGYIDDLHDENSDPYKTFSKTRLIRYDNATLFIENNIGYLGLIDFDHFSSLYKREKSCYALQCLTAIDFFPYHLEEIITVAKRFDPQIEKYRKSFEKEKAGTLERFKKVYIDHVTFIKEKNIPFDNPAQLPLINQSRQKSILEGVSKYLLKETKFNNYLGENQEIGIQLFAEAFPKIFKNVMNSISIFINRNVEELNNKTINSYVDLACCRTLLFKTSGSFYSELEKQMIEDLADIKSEGPWNKNALAYLIFKGICYELSQGKEIAYFNPELGYGSHAVCCIFC